MPSGDPICRVHGVVRCRCHEKRAMKKPSLFRASQNYEITNKLALLKHKRILIDARISQLEAELKSLSPLPEDD